MRFSKFSPRLMVLALAALAICPLQASAQAKKLKVFIMAGQSNMEGHAQIATFEYMKTDPQTAPLLKDMLDADGKPVVLDNVRLSYYTGIGDDNFEVVGKMTAGYGSIAGLPKEERTMPAQDRYKPTNKIGPEFTYALYMSKALKEPFLIIKTAWGGKSLHTDFRPPSAGKYELNEFQKKLYYGPPAHGVPKDMNEWLATKEKETGVYYKRMVDHVQSVLKDIKRVYPTYNPAQGYEIAGFVWLQGWNDMVDSHTYSQIIVDGKPVPDYSKYSEWLADLIRDLRKDLNAPKMPVVIGVMGVSGNTEAGKKPGMQAFRAAMAAPASMPEFKGTVTAVQTAPFWPEDLDAILEKKARVANTLNGLKTKSKWGPNADGSMTPEAIDEYMKKFIADNKLEVTPEEEAKLKIGTSNQGYHYLGAARIFALMGKAFAEANLELMKR